MFVLSSHFKTELGRRIVEITIHNPHNSYLLLTELQRRTAQRQRGTENPSRPGRCPKTNVKQLFSTLAKVVPTSKPSREGYTSFKGFGLKEPKPPKPSLKSETIIVEEISKKSVEKRRPAEIGIFFLEMLKTSSRMP